MIYLTIFSHWLEHSLQNVIVDNDVQQTDAVEVAIEYQREDGAEEKHL